MKKLIIALSVLLILVSMSSVRAESSATIYSGNNNGEQQVFTWMTNNSGGAITSNRVVVLDTFISKGNVTLGSAFITTTITGSVQTPIIGVTDENIASGSVGQVCIRGPHKVEFVTGSPPAFSDTVTTGTTAGYAVSGTSTANHYNYLGTALAATASTDKDFGPNTWWIWVRPITQ